MKSNPFYSLKDLILSLDGVWDDTMLDVIPKFPLYYCSEDEVFTDDTHHRKLNHDTPESWLIRYSRRYYSKDHDQWLTMAHCHYGHKDKLLGNPVTEEERQYLIQWRIMNPDKVKARSDRNNAKPEHKFKSNESMGSLLASEWMISNDITLYHQGAKNPNPNVFQANIPYKWSQLKSYYQGLGGTQAAMSDGWYKL